MNDIFITIIVSIFTAIATSVILDLIKRYGKLKLYNKFAFTQVNNDNNKYFIQFPLDVFIEIQNTTRETMTIRDFNGFLVKDNKIVTMLTQGSGYSKNNIITKTGTYGNNGSYSFISPPRSIEKYELSFLRLFESNIEADTLIFRYFDDSDKAVYLHSFYIESDKSKCKMVQPQYVLLKKTRKPINAKDFA